MDLLKLLNVAGYVVHYGRRGMESAKREWRHRQQRHHHDDCPYGGIHNPSTESYIPRYKPPVTPGPTVSSQNRSCAACGRELSERARFCGSCGQPVAVGDLPHVRPDGGCPNCSARCRMPDLAEQTRLRCPRCGIVFLAIPLSTLRVTDGPAPGVAKDQPEPGTIEGLIGLAFLGGLAWGLWRIACWLWAYLQG